MSNPLDMNNTNKLATVNQPPAPRTMRGGVVREILLSPGFGAGWSTWNTDHKEMLYDAEIIAHLKAGGETLYSGHPLLAKYEAAGCYIGGVRDLRVTTATTPFRINEYDGSESVEEFSPDAWEF